MDEYYGSTLASSDFFAHYGVKGMKWGVRKAIEKNSPKKLARQYEKARRKLDRLERNADIDTQKRLSERYNKAAKISAGIGGAGLGGAIGSHGVYQILRNNYWNKDGEFENLLKNRKYQNEMRQALSDRDYDKYYEMHNKEFDAMYKAIGARDNLDEHGSRAITAKKISAGIAAAGLGTAAGLKAKSMLAKYRTTAKGHKEAENKAKEFRKAVDETFNQPEAQRLSVGAIGRISDAASKSTRRKIGDKIKNERFVAEQKRKQESQKQKQKKKQAKRRAILEKFVGNI